MLIIHFLNLTVLALNKLAWSGYVCKISNNACIAYLLWQMLCLVVSIKFLATFFNNPVLIYCISILWYHTCNLNNFVLSFVYIFIYLGNFFYCIARIYKDNYNHYVYTVYIKIPIKNHLTFNLKFYRYNNENKYHKHFVFLFFT